MSGNLIVNRDKPPFDNADLRRAMALALDRKAFIDILFEGQADIGGTMLPPPAGLWGDAAGDAGDASRATAPTSRRTAPRRARSWRSSATGPTSISRSRSRRATSRSTAIPAVILIDQLKEIYIDGELDRSRPRNWFSKVARKDYALGLNLTGNAVDDPDQAFYENYACGSERNYTEYCNKDIEKLFDQQSLETDVEKRKKLVWEIDKKLQEDVARPIIYHIRAATCWQP